MKKGRLYREGRPLPVQVGNRGGAWGQKRIGKGRRDCCRRGSYRAAASGSESLLPQRRPAGREGSARASCTGVTPVPFVFSACSSMCVRSEKRGPGYVALCAPVTWGIWNRARRDDGAFFRRPGGARRGGRGGSGKACRRFHRHGEMFRIRSQPQIAATEELQGAAQVAFGDERGAVGRTPGRLTTGGTT